MLRPSCIMNKFYEMPDFCYCNNEYQSVQPPQSGGRYGAARAFSAIYKSFMLQICRYEQNVSISGHAIPPVSSGMTNSAVERLNDGQRDCLRLVLAHHNSKEIARELGVSPHTIDQRLRTAMRIMEVPSRFEAARKFAAFEADDLYQPLIYQMPDVERGRKNGKLVSPTERTASDRTGSTDDISNVDGNIAVVAFDRSEIGRLRLPVPRYRGERNSLGTVARLGWILAIAIASALSFGGLIAGLEALSRLKG